jgi:hypothetical protein
MKDTAQRNAEGAVASVREMGEEAAARVGHVANSMGGRIRSAAESVRETTAADGPVAHAANTVADKLDRVGGYLEEQDLSGVKDDVEGIIRRYPVETLLVGVSVGYLLARRLYR